jgi:hypothetical protein
MTGTGDRDALLARAIASLPILARAALSSARPEAVGNGLSGFADSYDAHVFCVGGGSDVYQIYNPISESASRGGEDELKKGRFPAQTPMSANTWRSWSIRIA